MPKQSIAVLRVLAEEVRAGTSAPAGASSTSFPAERRNTLSSAVSAVAPLALAHTVAAVLAPLAAQLVAGTRSECTRLCFLSK
jgi:hypothetical protein